MLTSLTVNNFKSWEEIDRLRLAPLTGLFGPNSSGKSSIIQLLLLLKQTVESSDRAQVLNLGDERSLVALGTFGDVVFRHDESRRLSWTLHWQLQKELRVLDPARKSAALFAGKDIGFTAEVGDAATGRLVVDELAYTFAGRCFGMARKSESEAKYKLFSTGGDFQFRRMPGRAWDLPSPVRYYGFPDQVKAYYQNAGFLADFELALEEFFGRVYYLGPLREYPQRQYTWAGAQPADMGQRGEKVVDAILASRERGEKISRGAGRKRFTVEEYVAWWLRELGLIHDFSVEPITDDSNLYRVWVRKTPGASRVLITDVGFGVSQILPVIALCYYVPEGSTIILEQPEIHLHPAVQAGLADVFVDAMRVRGVQIVLESHSEHLLRRLQRRIAEEKLTGEEVALYFCEATEGRSRATELELDIFGRIENWPEGFFGDEFTELAATSTAIARRKSA